MAFGVQTVPSLWEGLIVAIDIPEKEYDELLKTLTPEQICKKLNEEKKSREQK